MTVIFQSRPDGEHRLCTTCQHKGYGPDAWHPCTTDFWQVVRGRIDYTRCLACKADFRHRCKGVVTTGPQRISL